MIFLKKAIPLVLAFVLLLPCYGTETDKEDVFCTSYRDCLSRESAVVYDTFLKNAQLMKDGKSEIDIYFENGVAEEEINTVLQKAASAFSLDHPELFWVSYNKLSFVYTLTDGKVHKITAEKKEDEENYYSEPYSSKEQIEEDEKLIYDSIDAILEKAENCTSRYEKLLLFHDTLCNDNVYNSYVKKGENEKADERAWEAFSAFTSDNDPEKGPVCEGYSKAFKMLCDASGITCVLIPGDGINNNGSSGAHMWCAVDLYGRWYGVDVTWDDAENAKHYAHFLCGKETFDFKNTHLPNVEKYYTVQLPVPDISESVYKYDVNSAKADIGSSDVTVVYGDRAKVTVDITYDDGTFAHGKFKLYKNTVHNNNLIGEYQLENGTCIAEFDTFGMSCLNNVTLVIEYGENVSLYCLEIKPKNVTLDSTDVKIEYSNGIPYHTGELKADGGIRLHYTQSSEMTDDKKMMKVSFANITPYDANYVCEDSLDLELDVSVPENNEEKSGVNYVFIIVCAVGVVLCVKLSQLKRD